VVVAAGEVNHLNILTDCGGSVYYINPPVMDILSSPIFLAGENPGYDIAPKVRKNLIRRRRDPAVKPHKACFFKHLCSRYYQFIKFSFLLCLLYIMYGGYKNPKPGDNKVAT
jgi:hypothetical protein